MKAPRSDFPRMHLLHFTIESLSPRVSAGPRVEVSGLTGRHVLPTLSVPVESRGQPLSVTFDHVAENLQREPGVFWEPDGSFVWTVHHPSVRLEGQLADGATWLQHIELCGSLTPGMFKRLIQLSRADAAAQLMFQLVRTGVYVDEPSLRSLLPTTEVG